MNSIYFQNVNNSYPSSFTFQSVVNPIEVYVSGEYAVCISYQENQFPVSTPHLYATCSQGAYGLVQNYTISAATQKITNAYLHRIVTGEDNLPASQASTSGQYLKLYVKPSLNASLIVLSGFSTGQSFSYYISGYQCQYPFYFPVGPGGTCSLMDALPSSGSQYFIVPAGLPIYFAFNATSTWNEFTVTVESDINQFEVYIQSGYIPTPEWYLEKSRASLGAANITIVSPASSFPTNYGDAIPSQYFIMIVNTSPFDISVNTTLRYTTCPYPYFGQNCAYSTTIKIPSLSLPLSFTRNNVENGFYFFQLLNYPNYPPPYYIRVSVASTTNGATAPILYARRGIAPSHNAYNYVVNTQTSVNQVLIRVASSDFYSPISSTNAWYFGVPSDHSNFELWTGYNCANNCTQAGTCYCNGGNCYTETSGGRNLEPLYARPYTVVDSGGVCDCEPSRSGFSCNSTFSSYLSFANALSKILDYLPFQK